MSDPSFFRKSLSIHWHTNSLSSHRYDYNKNQNISSSSPLDFGITLERQKKLHRDVVLVAKELKVRIRKLKQYRIVW